MGRFQGGRSRGGRWSIICSTQSCWIQVADVFDLPRFVLGFAGAGRMSPVRGKAPAASGQVRIVGGRWRNTRLQVPELPGLRPTSDRVRETLFNWLMPKLPGARVLDLFAGSGALGLEAVSRGAASAQLVERDPQLAAALRGVVGKLGAGTQVEDRRTGTGVRQSPARCATIPD